MTAIEIVQKILASNPQVTEEQILEMLRDEKARSGGLLADETLLRLIAAKFGVVVAAERHQQQRHLIEQPIVRWFKRCYGGGSLNRCFPIRTFEGEKPGKYATLMIADNEGICGLCSGTTKQTWLKAAN